MKKTNNTYHKQKYINKSVLEMTNSSARKFFLKAESYCNIDFPPYIVFKRLLSEISRALNKMNEIRKKGDSPRNYTNINYSLLQNKDGKYAWRKFDLIHPVLYVFLVHKITEEKNWNVITQRFRLFSVNKKLECMSIPLESKTNRKDKAAQITDWWQNVEQRSIELALEYEYIIHTDITDCYSSIYTHSIAWALHGKDVAKNNRKKNELIGNFIDNAIQDFSHGQTNGISQGSVLMDFIAEMVLGYMDLELSSELSSIQDYHIIRYRDDYRIFVNNPQVGNVILKKLTEIAISLGLRLNPSKTKISNNVIVDSIKNDKTFWINHIKKNEDRQKELLIIHQLSKGFPNSGSLNIALLDYYKNIMDIKKYTKPLLPLVSIAIDIAYHNPNTYSIIAGILSKLISLINSDQQKLQIISNIIKKFDTIPYNGYLEIWLQRVTISIDKNIKYKENICEIINGGKKDIWNNAWISNQLISLIKAIDIIDRKKLKLVPKIIQRSEIDFFISQTQY